MMKFFKILGGGELSGFEYEARILMVDENNNLVMSFKNRVISFDGTVFDNFILAGDSGCFIGTIDDNSLDKESDLFSLSDEEFTLVWNEVQ